MCAEFIQNYEDFVHSLVELLGASYLSLHHACAVVHLITFRVSPRHFLILLN